MQLANAMLRAGVVSKNDVERAQRQQTNDIARAQRQRTIDQVADNRFNAAIQSNPVADEIRAWMKTTGRVVPIKVLEQWADLGAGATSEWAKWLAAYRESLPN